MFGFVNCSIKLNKLIDQNDQYFFYVCYRSLYSHSREEKNKAFGFICTLIEELCNRKLKFEILKIVQSLDCCDNRYVQWIYE